MHNRRLSSRSRAFSLVEILIVVFLIGILSAIAIPQLLGAGQLVGDGAAQAQLETSALNATARSKDVGTFEGVNDTYLEEKEPDIAFEPANVSSAVTGDTRSVSVGTSADNRVFYAAALGETGGNCWYIKLTVGAATEYGVSRNSTSCTATDGPAATYQTQSWPASD